MPYILALDEGTTSARAIVFDHDGSVRAVAQKEIKQIYPKPGWVEHDAHEIWTSQMAVAIEALGAARIRPNEVAAIGITNQRETTVVWDRQTGEAIHNAIVWQDRRTAAMCDKLRARGGEKFFQKRTGLILDAYFSGTKLAWLLDHVPGARRKADAGRLAFGTIDSWLLWKLTRRHATDPSNASRTLLYNIHTGQWDKELLRLLRIPESLLPEVRSSSEVYGRVRLPPNPQRDLGSAGASPSPAGLAGIPVGGIAGDQQAALFGQMCIKPGLTKNTYGTGCFMLQNTGTKAVASKNRLLTTVAWKIGNKTEYALEGSVFIGGAVVQWLRDGLGLIRSAAEIEKLAGSVPDNGGVYLVPAFSGLGAPHWDQYARGTMVGLTRDTSAGHFARAALESIAYQVADLQDAMHSDAGIRLKELRVDGGAVQNNLLMQFQADILGVPVVRPKVTESTALGAAYLAGLAVGYWRKPQEIASQWQVEQRFEPKMPRAKAHALRERWSKAVERAKDWEQR
jgi:glycerol kinase